MVAVDVGGCVATRESVADVKDLADLESEEDESEKGSRELHKQTRTCTYVVVNLPEGG